MVDKSHFLRAPERDDYIAPNDRWDNFLMFYSREKHNVVVLEKWEKTKVMLDLPKQPFLSIVPYWHVASLITP